MRYTKLLWLLPLALTACESNERSGSGYYAKNAKSAVQTEEADSAAAVPPLLNSPERKIIRTADFSCRVLDVFAASSRLEKLVRSVNGIVAESNMATNISSSSTVDYKEDSLKQVQTYTTTSSLTLRVPFAALDSVVQAIPSLATFIDHRVLKQEDVTMQYTYNNLRNNNTSKLNETTRAMQLAKKSKEPIEVAEYVASKEDEKLTRQMENAHIQEDVNYATITVALTQPEQVHVLITANPDYIGRTPISVKCISSLREGWYLVSALFVFILRLWPLYAIVTLAFFIYWKWFQKKPVVQHV